MEVNRKYFNGRTFSGAFLFTALAFLAGSNRLIQYFPNTTPSGLVFSALMGSATAIASHQYATQKESEFKRVCRVILALNFGAVILAPIATKLLRRTQIKLQESSALKMGAQGSAIEGLLSFFISLQPKEEELPIDQQMKKLGEEIAQLSVDLKEVSHRIQAKEIVSTTKITDWELTALFNEFPELANMLSKDNHTVQILIGNSLRSGLPILQTKPKLNREFIESLNIALNGMIQEKNLSRKKERFQRLCDAFKGCQPEQQRVTSIIAGEVQAFAGSLENYLYEQVYALLDTVLEQTITHHHGKQMSQGNLPAHLQMPHIKSRYLREFAKQGFYLPNYEGAAHDHILKGVYGGIPPYNSKGINTFRRLVKKSFQNFVDQVALELSQEDESISKWLNDLYKTDEKMQGLGWFSEEKKELGYYIGQKPATDSQEYTICPYVSKREMLYLLKHFNLLFIRC